MKKVHKEIAFSIVTDYQGYIYPADFYTDGTYDMYSTKEPFQINESAFWIVRVNKKLEYEILAYDHTMDCVIEFCQEYKSAFQKYMSSYVFEVMVLNV
jgi:hypothetical protein